MNENSLTSHKSSGVLMKTVLYLVQWLEWYMYGEDRKKKINEKRSVVAK